MVGFLRGWEFRVSRDPWGQAEEGPRATGAHYEAGPECPLAGPRGASGGVLFGLPLVACTEWPLPPAKRLGLGEQGGRNG